MEGRKGKAQVGDYMGRNKEWDNEFEEYGNWEVWGKKEETKTK